MLGIVSHGLQKFQVLLLIDASYGFELETVEFIHVLQVQQTWGSPCIFFGVCFFCNAILLEEAVGNLWVNNGEHVSKAWVSSCLKLSLLRAVTMTWTYCKGFQVLPVMQMLQRQRTKT